MTIKQINKELNAICKERTTWNGAKGPFTKSAIKKRGLVLIKQNLLSRIEDSTLLGEQSEEHFYALLYQTIDDYSKLIK